MLDVTVYRRVYTIVINETVNVGKWYYSRAGREFDAEMIEDGENSYFKIDYVHKIPCEYASVVRFRKEVKYTRY